MLHAEAVFLGALASLCTGGDLFVQAARTPSEPEGDPSDACLSPCERKASRNRSTNG